MRQRLFLLMLSSFGVPILYLTVEAILWAVQAPTLMGTLIELMPELLGLLLILWLFAITYSTGRVVWLATVEINPLFVRTGARATGVIVISFILVSAGSYIISTWLPQVTVRTVHLGEKVGK